MKLINFKVFKGTGVVYFREASIEEDFEEIWLPENKVEKLSHEFDCGKDYYYVNEYMVTNIEFKNVLKQLQGE